MATLADHHSPWHRWSWAKSQRNARVVLCPWRSEKCRVGWLQYEGLIASGWGEALCLLHTTSLQWDSSSSVSIKHIEKNEEKNRLCESLLLLLPDNSFQWTPSRDVSDLCLLGTDAPLDSNDDFTFNLIQSDATRYSWLANKHPSIKIQKQAHDSFKLSSAQLQAYFEMLSGVTNSFVASNWEAAVHYVSTNTLKIRNTVQNTRVIIAWVRGIKKKKIK